MRLLLCFLAAYHGANGAIMLVAPGLWYDLAPGADHTGPANTHFIRDIGLAFLAASAALVLATRVANAAMPIFIATVFLGGHALLHIVEMAAHGTSLTAAVRDVFFIVIPAALPAVFLLGRPRAAGEVA